MLLVGCLICQPIHRQYLLPYATPLHIITLQLRYAMTSATVLLLPLVVLHMAYSPMVHTLIDNLKTVMLSALFFYMCECVRYLRLNNDLLNTIVAGSLFVLLLGC